MTRALVGVLLLLVSLACKENDSVPDTSPTSTAAFTSPIEAVQDLSFACGGAGVNLDACIAENDTACRDELEGEDCDALREIESQRTITPIHLLAGDLTGNAATDMLLHAMPVGCGNCRSQVLILLEDGQVLWEREVYDAEVRIGPPCSPTGFWLKEPTMVEGEPGCCPSSYVETLYEWNGSDFARPTPQP